MIDRVKVPWGNDEKNLVKEWKELKIIWVEHSERNEIPIA